MDLRTAESRSSISITSMKSALVSVARAAGLLDERGPADVFRHDDLAAGFERDPRHREHHRASMHPGRAEVLLPATDERPEPVTSRLTDPA